MPRSKVEYSVISLVEPDVLEERTMNHVQGVRRLVLDAMDEQGINKTELAVRMGISKSHLSNVLNSQTNLTLEMLARFELALGVLFEISIKAN